MRSRARALPRRAAAAAAFVAVSTVAAGGPLGPGTAHAADKGIVVETRATMPVGGLGAHVGALAVALGVGGMVAGVVRRRRGNITVDPGNERKSPQA